MRGARLCNDLTPELLQRALDGDSDAQRTLIEKLTPEIHFNVAKMLRRWRTGSAASRHLRQEIEDLVQEAFLELVKDDFKALRRWDPERLPLDAYVGYIAKIRTAGFLRSRRSPWREDPNPWEDLDRDDPGATPEDRALTHDEFTKIWLCLVASFSAEDFHLFDLLFIQQVSPKEATEITGKSIDAIYKWRSRLYERARKCRDELSEDES